MAATNTWDTENGRAPWPVDIYRWSSSGRHFGAAIQRLYTFQQASAIHLTESRKDSSIFLFLAEKSGLIRVYRLNHDHKLVEVQQILVGDVPSVSQIESTVLPDGELAVTMLHENHLIRVYQLMGSNGFMAVDSIAAYGVTKFSLIMEERGHLLILVKSCSRSQNFKLPICHDANLVLKAKIV